MIAKENVICFLIAIVNKSHFGLKAAFDYENNEEFYRVTCWAHVERKCQEKTNCLSQPTRDELLLDIKNMQAMPSTSSFNKAV